MECVLRFILVYQSNYGCRVRFAKPNRCQHLARKTANTLPAKFATCAPEHHTYRVPWEQMGRHNRTFKLDMFGIRAGVIDPCRAAPVAAQHNHRHHKLRLWLAYQQSLPAAGRAWCHRDIVMATDCNNAQQCKQMDQYIVF